MATLLGVDLGLRTGVALYGEDGRLRRYWSRHFGSMGQFRRGVAGIIEEQAELGWLVIEGGGPLALVWQREAERRGVRVRQISAEHWRTALLYGREQRSGAQAKGSADTLARRVIAWSGAARPTTLRHDTAEAIMIGLWGVLEVGWLAALPAEIRRS